MKGAKSSGSANSRHLLVGAISLATLVPATVYCSKATAEDWRFSGYLKDFTIVSDELDYPFFSQPVTYQTQPSIRLKAERFEDSIALEIHYELGADISSRLSAFNATSGSDTSAPYRMTDLSETLGDDDGKHRVIQNLDRFNVELNLTGGDLTLGRQAITFGAARIINPTDVFLPYDVRTLNTEYRIGVDGIRFQKPIGQLSELDMGVVLGDNGSADNSAGFLRYTTNSSGNDYQFSYIHFRGNNLFGLGLMSSILEAGAWAEIAYVNADRGDDYTQISAGLDYAFSEDVFAMVEYHYNGAGSENPQDYLSLSQQPAYVDGGVFLLGEHYLIPSLSWQASPLLTVSGQLLYNLSDDSSFASVSLDYSLTENLYFGAGLYEFWGDDLKTLFSSGTASRAESGAASIQPGSEYGASPTTLYVSLRYYF